MNHRRLFYIPIILTILLISMTACSDSKEKSKEKTFDPKPDPDAEQVTSYDDEMMIEQEKKDKELQAEYDKDNYTLDNPYFKLDPYDAAPLTALVMFETKAPTQISITVEGENGQQPMKKTWEGYEEKHKIPVLGLFPDTDNTIKLTAKNKEGATETTEFTVTTDPLPEDFLNTELNKAKTDKMEDGLTFIVPTKDYLYAVDDNADVRWYSSLPSSMVFKRLKNGNVLQITKDDDDDSKEFDKIIEADMLGKIKNAYNIDIPGYDNDIFNLIHHDMIELPNGNFLATAHESDSDYEQDEMIEIDRKTGKTNRHINAKDILPESAYEDYDGKNAEDGDWFHQNTIFFDDSDNSILVSGRSQDLIMKLSYPDAEIQWILAADEGWPDNYKDYLLKPKNDDVKFPAGQHAVKILPDQDDNPDTIDILLFDNNKVFTRGDNDVSGDYSRIVQYRVNEKDNTVKEVWSYGEDRGKDLYSSIVGNAQYLSNTKNRLMTSGYIETEDVLTNKTGKVVEVTGQEDPEVVYEITISDFTKEGNKSKQLYRGLRMPLYPE